MLLNRTLSIINLTIIFVLFIIKINCETIHFTNSPNSFIRKKNFTSYKLEVPGSNSITIIEANTPQPFDSKSQENHNSDSLLESGSSLNKKTVYAPSLLEKFMNEYNIKVSTHLQSKLTTQDSTTNSDTKRILKRDYNDHLETEDNYHNQKQNYYDNRPQSSIIKKDGNPFNEKEGWVTLQAIPWSKSKVSKWKPKAEIKPVGGYNLYNEEQKSTYGINNEDIVSSNYDNLRPNFYDNDDEYTNNKNYNDNRRSKPTSVPWNSNDYHNKPIDNPSSTFEKPQIEVAPNYDRWYDYGFRPDLENRFEQKPLLTKPTIHQQNYYPNDNRFANNDDDYIHNTGTHRNGDSYSTNRNEERYPKPYSYNDRMTSSESQYSNHFINRHPITHPSNGKGEWVLVSTTKGYQHRPSPTRSAPRGIKYSNTNTDGSTSAQSALSQRPVNYRTHKSIKLTVLPAETEDGKLKPMKLSHGGLLEVESSAQSVEDSAVASKKKKVVKRKAGLVPMQFVPVTTGQKIDKTAVLAAVSAGMIPASMAMLMPLVLGRKKRSLSNKNIETNKEIFNYENIFQKRKALDQKF